MADRIHIRPAVMPAQEYRIAMPLATHWEVASCEDIDCAAFLNGWRTVLPADSDLISTLKRSGRKYREERQEDGTIAFLFAPGQTCFAQLTHRRQSDRPGLFLHRNIETATRGRVVTENEWIERNQETLWALEQVRE